MLIDIGFKEDIVNHKTKDAPLTPSKQPKKISYN